MSHQHWVNVCLQHANRNFAGATEMNALGHGHEAERYYRAAFYCLAEARNNATLDAFDGAYEVRTDGQVHTGPINVDSMPDEDLDIAAHHPALHGTVKYYASVLLDARKAKRAAVTRALRLEAKCERIYAAIPEVCKW